MNITEFVDFCDEMMIAEEAFNKDSLNNFMENAKIIGQKVADKFEDILNAIILYSNAFVSRAKGYKMYKEINDVLNVIIDHFNDFIDTCTYNAEKFIRGFTRDINGHYKGKVFNPETITDREKKELKHLHSKIMIYQNQVMVEGAHNLTVASAVDTIRTQKNILNLNTKLRRLMRTIQFTPEQKKQIEFMHMSDYVQQQMNLNKPEIMELAKLYFEASSCALVNAKTDGMKGVI